MDRAILRLAFWILLVVAAQGQNRPEEQLARQILATMESEAQSASPDVRAFVWMRLATGLDDKPRQRKLLQEAYLTTLKIPVLRYDTRWELQEEILNEMLAEAGPEALEEVMPRADDYSRFITRGLLITRYAEDGNIDRALALLQGAADQGEYPFEAAETLMDKLPPPERKGLRRTIFAQAVGIASGNQNFMLVAPLLVKFWRDLPSEQVLQVIDKVLQEARMRDACPLKQPTRYYADYVGQFLPILRQLDPAKAERLEKEKASGGPPPEECDYDKMFGIRTSAPKGTATPTATPAPVATRPYVPRPQRLVFGCPADGFCREKKIEQVLREINRDLKWNAIEEAKREIENGFAMAAEEWKYDTDHDDPNLWPTYVWPSTVNWEAFAMLASYVSPSYALEQTDQIPDAGNRLITREMLAEYWLKRDIRLPAPNILNDEGSGCECVEYGVYIPRHWGEKLP